MLNSNFNAIRFSLSRSFTTVTHKELVDAFTYCVQVVRVRDFENYLWCTQLPKEDRAGIFAIRAFNVETASVIERAGSGDVFVQMRFKWWQDAVTNLYKNNPPRNPIFIALSEVLQRRHLTRYRMKKIVETRLTDALRKAPPDSVAELEDYATGTAVQVLLLQLEALGAENDEEAAKAAEYIGRAVGLTNLLRGTPHHADRGVVFFPKDILMEHQVEEGVVLRKESTDGVKLVAEEIAGRARELLVKARELRGGTEYASRRVLLPATVAELYLDALHRYKYDVFDPRLIRASQGLLQPRLQLVLKYRSFMKRY